ncbi:MAG: MFS transporter [Pseudomonadota bacterium]
MLNRIFNFYKTGENKPLFSDDQNKIKKVYEQKRLSVFLTITIGYGLFYLCRLSFSVVKKPLLDAGIMNAEEMGIIGSGLFISYAVGKLLNGFLADRSDIRKFMSTGLMISAIMNLLLGLTTYFWFFLIIWIINGWFQSMGSAPSVVSISHWFSNKERGTRYGIWSIGHSLGEGLTFIGTATLVSLLGWRFGFIGPGLVCIIVALLMLLFHADRPQTYGLPHISDYKKDYSALSSGKKSTGKLQLEVLKNPYIIILGFSSALMYVARYAINNWAILYMQEAKGYELIAAGSILSAYPIMGLLGAASSGWISDKFFNSKRNIPTLLYGLLQVSTLIMFFIIPPGYQYLDMIALSFFGFALGGQLVFIGGLIAVDISSKKAAGAAMGVIGVFSYIGAAIQDWISGHLIHASKIIINGKDVYNFDSAFYFWIGASIVSLILACCVWNAKAKE